MRDEFEPLHEEDEEDLEALFAAAVASVEARRQQDAPEVDLVEEDEDFDPGEWGEPPPSAVDAAQARASELEAELDVARVQAARAEDELTRLRAELDDLQQRSARNTARARRLKEAYDRLKLRADDDRAQLEQRDALLAELRAEARDAERERERHRMRVEREVQEARLYGNERLIKELLPVIDNLDLAMSHADGDPAATVEGLRMIVSQLDRTLQRVGLSRVDSRRGVPFDPQAHEAITYTEHAEVPGGCIVETHQVGYRLNERLVRAARVSVARNERSIPPLLDDAGEGAHSSEE